MSEAQAMMKQLAPVVAATGDLPVLGIPAPCSVHHQKYSVGYFADRSILVWAKGEGLHVFDAQRTYNRDTIEHLARCLSIPKHRRAYIVGSEQRWIDGVLWSPDGSFLDVD